MTTNEITILLDRVKAVIDNYNSYYVWYSVSPEETWNENGSYVTFEVFGYSDQDEGSNWTEYWSIDNTGRIVRDGEIYENFDEFKDNWL